MVCQWLVNTLNDDQWCLIRIAINMTKPMQRNTKSWAANSLISVWKKTREFLKKELGVPSESRTVLHIADSSKVAMSADKIDLCTAQMYSCQWHTPIERLHQRIFSWFIHVLAVQLATYSPTKSCRAVLSIPCTSQTTQTTAQEITDCPPNPCLLQMPWSLAMPGQNMSVESWGHHLENMYHKMH